VFNCVACINLYASLINFMKNFIGIEVPQRLNWQMKVNTLLETHGGSFLNTIK
jgi:hypothetical protein